MARSTTSAWRPSRRSTTRATSSGSTTTWYRPSDQTESPPDLNRGPWTTSAGMTTAARSGSVTGHRRIRAQRYRPRLDEAGFIGDDHELGAVVCVQLGEQAADVGFDRGDTDVETRGDIGVGVAGGDVDQDLL